MAGQVLGHAVDDEIGAKGEGLLEDRRGERVVDHDERTRGVRESRDRPDVRDEQPRIGRRLQPHQARGRGHRRRDGGEVSGIDRRNPQVESREHPVQQAVSAAIHIDRHDDLIVWPQVGLQHGVLGGEARGEHRPVFDALELRQHRFQPLTGGVVGPRVIEATVDARALLLERRGLVNRRNQRAGGGVTGLSGVDGTSGKTHLVGCSGDGVLGG